MTVHILIVDDEQPIRDSLGGLFEDEGYLVSTAPSGEEAVARFRKHPVDCIFLDIWMPGIDGLETMIRIKKIDPNVPVIMMSGHATIDTAVKATKLGAFDFIEKPFSSDKLLILLRNAIDKRRLAMENSDLKFESHRDLPQLIGESAVMQSVREAIEKAAQKETPVLILGEHGTGKSIAARLLHEGSKRSNDPFVRVNAVAIGKDQVEHELFGYEKGAFSGALQSHRGRLEAAHQGSVYFDEITDVSFQIQVSLLKVMLEHRIQRIGGSVPVPCDIRVIAGSLYQEESAKKRLTQALYERLNGTVIHMPNLRNRPEDISLLLSYFAARQAVNLGGDAVKFSDDVISVLEAYDWPGNMRELRNYVERCHILCAGKELTLTTMLPLDASAQSMPAFSTVPDDTVLTDGFHDARKRFECSYIVHHLEKNDWNVSKTAAEIGMERSQLHRKIKSHDLIPPQK